MKYFANGEPCDHPGCLQHITHPCEGCGRVGGITRCSSLECYSTAVAMSTIGNYGYCLECSIKVVRQHGPTIVTAIPPFSFPWKEGERFKCSKCGVTFTKYLMGLTGDCPKCRKDLPDEITGKVSKKPATKKGETHE